MSCMLVSSPSTTTAVRRNPSGRGVLHVSALEGVVSTRMKGSTAFSTVCTCVLLPPLFTDGLSPPQKDDLPVIRENIRKGFLDTQTKVSSWFQTVKKRIDGEEEEGGQASQGYGNEGYNRPRRSGDLGRRSGDRERYDADPQVLGDDFSALELRDSEGLTSLAASTVRLG